MKRSPAPSLLLLSIASAVAATTPAFAAGTPALTGQWNVHNSIAGNESDQKCTFTLNDKDLTGSCKSGENTVQITGSLDGNKLTWKYNSDYNGTQLTLIYAATLDDSGKIAGTVEVQPFGVTGDFTATPSKADEAPQK
jgi:hypothetical protein